MKITILVDNHACGELPGEWGLSAYCRYGDLRVLLDAGQSDLFLQNAAALGIDLDKVDFGVLSHAHYDHADGISYFLDANQAAPFYLRKGCDENCYEIDPDGTVRYIGIRKGLLAKYADRIRYAEGDAEIAQGVFLIPHKTAGMEEQGRAAHMFILVDGCRLTETFAHEQSLVFRTEKGLVILNSCSHGGADNIITEVAETFPGEKLYAIIGGFHLYMKEDEEVRAFARRLRDTGICHVITGHCTGDRGYEILQEELGDRIRQLHVGMTIDL